MGCSIYKKQGAGRLERIKKKKEFPKLEKWPVVSHLVSPSVSHYVEVKLLLVVLKGNK